MKIAHIADTHFGKDLKKVNFADADQPFWIERFLEDIVAEQVDVVVMAGDIYDDKIQPIKAINLFGDFLTRLNNLGITIFIVPGNHDQADRLSANSDILKKQHIYFANEISRELLHITLPLADGKVVFWLLPYVEPLNVRRVLGRDDITNYDSAVRELLAVQPLDKEAVNIIVAHQNVLAGATERILNDHEVDIGYSGQVDYTAFAAERLREGEGRRFVSLPAGGEQPQRHIFVPILRRQPGLRRPSWRGDRFFGSDQPV